MCGAVPVTRRRASAASRVAIGAGKYNDSGLHGAAFSRGFTSRREAGAAQVHALHLCRILRSVTPARAEAGGRGGYGSHTSRHQAEPDRRCDVSVWDRTRTRPPDQIWMGAEVRKMLKGASARHPASARIGAPLQFRIPWHRNRQSRRDRRALLTQNSIRRAIGLRAPEGRPPSLRRMTFR